MNKKLILKTRYHIHVINYNDILRVEALGNRTLFCFKNNTSILVSKNIKVYQTGLQIRQFYRIHASHIINLECVERYNSTYLTLNNGDEIPISTDKRQNFLKIINNICISC